MDNSFLSRIKRSWNVFMNRDPTDNNLPNGEWSCISPGRRRYSRGNDKTFITSIYNKIAVDAASVNIRHVRTDANGRFVETVHSGLNNCLSLEANIDQGSRAFVQDIVASLLDEGSVAIVPIDIDTEVDPKDSAVYDILTMRTGKIVTWYPRHVRIEVYDDRDGRRKEIVVPKHTVAIVENPFYSIMNEPNSTLKRLIRKLAILDAIDEESGAGKLDMIIQLPYAIKGEAREKKAEERRKSIEQQLTGSKYGIAYIDSTEHITQLNRSLENNLMAQIKYLTELGYSQLGVSTEILDGSANETTIFNYEKRIIEPILAAITNAITKTFLTKTARSQGQAVLYFQDPFRLVPVSQIADMVDKFTRNEILTSNEVRQIIGMKPSSDPSADELRNKNLNRSEGEVHPATTGIERTVPKQEENQNGT